MQLPGRSPTESLLPPRFERLYQPEKMAQFDRFFARSWATPVRRSHSAQHSGESDDESDVADFRRIISGSRREPYQLKREGPDLESSMKNGLDSSLEQFVDSYGFEPQTEPSLRMFVEHHDMEEHQLKHSESGISGR